MNLSINLIQPSEVRSASLVTAKTYILVSTIVVLLGSLMLIGQAWLSNSSQQAQLQFLEDQWQDASRRQREAQALEREVRELRSIHAAVSGWSYAQIQWPDFLDLLRDHIPSNIQLRTFQLRSEPDTPAGGGMRQTAQLTLGGFAAGPDAENTVEYLRSALDGTPPFDTWTDRARVSSFREDPAAGPDSEDRIFQLDIRFIPRSFDAPAGRSE